MMADQTLEELVRQMAAAQERADRAEAVLADAKRKIDFYDRFVQSKASYSMTETAKLLHAQETGRGGLIQTLRNIGILLPDGTPAQRYISRGFFVCVVEELLAGGRVRYTTVTRVTPRGIAWLHRRLGRLPALPAMAKFGGAA